VCISIVNGLSDHDVQFLTINNIYAATNTVTSKQRTGVINNETTMNFQTLENETWEAFCTDNDTNNMFNSFLYPFLNIFEASSPVKY
jgi:hypothetical protein